MREQLIEILRSGETSAKGRVGAEFEYFIVDADYRAVDYPTVAGILEELAPEAVVTTYEKDDLLGLRFEHFAITLEPGSQFEISVDVTDTLEALFERRRFLFDRLEPLLKARGLKLLATGYQPVTPIGEISLLPKDRYRWMHDYFESCGPLAHDMMKGSAAQQIAIDYRDEKDFVDKMRLGNILGLLQASRLDHTTYWAGKPYPGVNARLHIWNACDEDRCCQQYGAFEKDFGYAAYADYLLSVPPIFLDGKPTGRKILSQLPHRNDRATADHLMSMVFPFVRAKHYIEIRTLDSLPAPYDRAAVAFFKGLLADPANVRTLVDRYAAVTEAGFDGLKNALLESHNPDFLGESVDQHLAKLIRLAEQGLPSEEKKDLSPLAGLDRPLGEVLGRDLAPREVI